MLAWERHNAASIPEDWGSAMPRSLKQSWVKSAFSTTYRDWVREPRFVRDQVFICGLQYNLAISSQISYPGYGHLYLPFIFEGTSFFCTTHIDSFLISQTPAFNQNDMEQ